MLMDFQVDDSLSCKASATQPKLYAPLWRDHKDGNSGVWRFTVLFLSVKENLLRAHVADELVPTS